MTLPLTPSPESKRTDKGSNPPISASAIPPLNAAWWEHRYQTHDTPWDHAAPHPALEAWLATHPPPANFRVLVPGCGTGHDARLWAKAGAQVTGLDLAPSALAQARSLAGSDPITWLEGSIFDPPKSLRHAFDLVFEHTCFCAIDPARRPDYVRGVHACLKPGGHLLAIFYLDPGRDSGPPFGVSCEELVRLFSPQFQIVERTPPPATFPGREGREELRLLRALF